MTQIEVYYIAVDGVGIQCTDKESVLEWMKFALDKGLAPVVTKVKQAA